MHYRIIFLSALVAIVVGLIAATALANHSGAFLAGDSGFQYGPSEGDRSGLPELYTPETWTLSNSTSTVLYWHATSTELINYTTTATNNWMNAVPELSFSRTIQKSAADFSLVYSVCDFNSRGTVNFKDNDGGVWEDDTTRGARYWKTIEICINNTSLYSPADSVVAVIAHELGHLYGLHEQYNDEVSPPVCNPSQVSIRD